MYHLLECRKLFCTVCVCVCVSIPEAVVALQVAFQGTYSPAAIAALKTIHPLLSCPIPNYFWVEGVQVWVKALPMRHSSTANSAQPEIEPAISRLKVAPATTEPRHLT